MDGSQHEGGRRARLALLGHGAERTGPPIMLGHLLRGLAAAGRWDLSVLVARDGPLLPEYRRTGARATALTSAREPLEPLAAAMRRTGLGAPAARLQDAVRRRAAHAVAGADLVYVNAATPPTAALLHALDPPQPTPVLVHVHELDVGLRETLAPADRALLFARASHLVAASGAVADVLVHGHGIAPDRVTTCEEFVDVAALHPRPRAAVRAELGVPADAAVVGSVGLPDWRKDPEHLLRAVARLGERPGGRPWVVWIGGDPASVDGRHLADEARRLGVEDRLVHVAHRDDPAALLSALDVFALPAREDALPLAALEAAGTGLPLVCFRTGGVAALCDQGAGTAVDYPDTAAFAEAIGRFLDDPTAREAAGARARSIVATHHDLEPGVARIAAVVDRLLG
ncbi:MAG: glycosyltransferase family 4 protein [Actinobacteria bacterium]|nr:glycosyltransferase family 4 protein [Actinomycetota bacterium]